MPTPREIETFRQKVHQLRVQEIKDILKSFSAKFTGLKTELAERLVQMIIDKPPSFSVISHLVDQYSSSRASPYKQQQQSSSPQQYVPYQGNQHQQQQQDSVGHATSTRVVDSSVQCNFTMKPYYTSIAQVGTTKLIDCMLILWVLIQVDKLPMSLK